MRGLERAAEPLEDHAEPAQAPAQPRRTLVQLLLGGRSHLALDVGEQTLPAVRSADEQPQRLVEPAAVEVRVEVAQARRQAPAHLSVRGRILAEHEPRPQWRRPNSESSCSTSSCASRRPRSGPIVTAWPGAGSEATSRIGNGMSSRQRM